MPASMLETEPIREPAPPIGGKLQVFVSSVINELHAERNVVQEALRDSSLFIPWVFEYTTADSLPLPEVYLRRVRECDVFVLLVAESISEPVEMEYETAIESNKPILAFLRTGDRAANAMDFVAKVEREGAFKYAAFDGPDDLAPMVVEAVCQQIVDRYREYSAMVDEGLIPHPNIDTIVRAYAEEVIIYDMYSRWQNRYTSLRGVVELPRQYQTSERVKDAADGEAEQRKEYSDLRDVLNEHKGLILIADPGAGKTTTLQRLALDCAAALQQGEEGFIPVYMELGSYAYTCPLTEYARHRLESTSLEIAGELERAHAHRHLASNLEPLQKQGKILYLLDGVNELRRAERRQALDEIRNFVANALSDDCRVVATCRAEDFTEIGDIDHVTPVWVQELGEDRIDKFLQAHLGEDGAAELMQRLREDHRGLMDLARNPYQLWMIQAAYSEYGELPDNRTMLFGRMIDFLLRRQKEICERIEPEAWYDADVILAVLARLAYEMLMDPHVYTVAPLDWVDTILTGQEMVRGRVKQYDRDRLLALARAAHLTTEHESSVDKLNDPGTLRFTHQLLQEYLAAVYLNTLGIKDPAVQSCLRYDAWDEVIVLLAGMTSDCGLLVEDVFSVDPFLAARCVEIRPQELSDDLKSHLVDQLVGIAFDLYSPWRDEAIYALVRVDHPTASQTLSDLITRNEPEDVRSVAISALGRMHTDEAMSQLIELLVDDDRSIRRVALYKLAQMGASQAIGAITERLEDVAWEVREAALLALVQLRANQAKTEVVKRIDDDNREVRCTAVKATSVLLGPDAIPILEARLLEAENGSDMRGPILEVLSELLPEKYPPQVSLSSDMMVGTGGALCTELEAERPDCDLSEILNAVRSECPQMRRSAIQRLGELRAEEGLAVIIESLLDPDHGVRRVAVTSLKVFEKSKWLDSLPAWLEDQDPKVRRFGACALGELGADEATAALLAQLQDEDGPARDEAIWALTKLGVREVVPALLEKLQDGSLFDQDSALRALGRLGAVEGIPAMLMMLLEEYQIEALGRMPADALIIAVDPLRLHPDGVVQRLAALLAVGAAKRRSGEKRYFIERAGEYASRKALWHVVGLTDKALDLMPNWFVATRQKAAALRRLGTPSAAPRVPEQDAPNRTEEEKVSSTVTTSELAVNWSIARRKIKSELYADAATQVDYLLRKEPWHPETHGIKGQFHLARGEWKQADEAFGTANRHDPHEVRWPCGVAIARLGLEGGQALPALQLAIDHTELHEQVETALEDLQLLERANPDLPALAEVRARILQRKAFLDELAEREYQEYLQAREQLV